MKNMGLSHLVLLLLFVLYNNSIVSEGEDTVVESACTESKDLFDTFRQSKLLDWKNSKKTITCKDLGKAGFCRTHKSLMEKHCKRSITEITSELMRQNRDLVRPTGTSLCKTIKYMFALYSWNVDVIDKKDIRASTEPLYAGQPIPIGSEAYMSAFSMFCATMSELPVFDMIKSAYPILVLAYAVYYEKNRLPIEYEKLLYSFNPEVCTIHIRSQPDKLPCLVIVELFVSGIPDLIAKVEAVKRDPSLTYCTRLYQVFRYIENMFKTFKPLQQYEFDSHAIINRLLAGGSMKKVYEFLYDVYKNNLKCPFVNEYAPLYSCYNLKFLREDDSTFPPDAPVQALRSIFTEMRRITTCKEYIDHYGCHLPTTDGGFKACMRTWTSLCYETSFPIIEDRADVFENKLEIQNSYQDSIRSCCAQCENSDEDEVISFRTNILPDVFDDRPRKSYRKLSFIAKAPAVQLKEEEKDKTNKQARLKKKHCRKHKK